MLLPFNFFFSVLADAIAMVVDVKTTHGENIVWQMLKPFQRDIKGTSQGPIPHI